MTSHIGYYLHSLYGTQVSWDEEKGDLCMEKPFSYYHLSPVQTQIKVGRGKIILKDTTIKQVF